MHALVTPRRLSVALVVVMVVQSLLGLALRAQYRDVAWIAATWWGNDWITLALAAPLLVVALVLSSHGSVRGILLWAGMLAYGVYNYAFYLLGAELNVFFALYVAGVTLAAISLITLLAGLNAGEIAACFGPRTPARAVGAYLMFTAAGLAAVWLVTWAAYAFAGRPTPVDPEAFKVVAALDLVLMVPTLAIGGYLLFRRAAWGFPLAALAGVQATLYLLVLSVNSFVAIAWGLAEAPGEIPIWGTLLLGTSVATAVLFAHAGGCVHTPSRRA